MYIQIIWFSVPNTQVKSILFIQVQLYTLYDTSIHSFIHNILYIIIRKGSTCKDIWGYLFRIHLFTQVVYEIRRHVHHIII